MVLILISPDNLNKFKVIRLGLPAYNIKKNLFKQYLKLYNNNYGKAGECVGFQILVNYKNDNSNIFGNPTFHNASYSIDNNIIRDLSFREVYRAYDISMINKIRQTSYYYDVKYSRVVYNSINTIEFNMSENEINFAKNNLTKYFILYISAGEPILIEVNIGLMKELNILKS